jgi:histidinol dehydrogenase
MVNQPVSVRQLDTQAPDFFARLDELTRWEESKDLSVESTVRNIIHAVRDRGDAALLEFTNKFDERSVSSVAELKIENIASGREQIDPMLTQALENAAERIRVFHERQVQESWSYQEPDGTVLGQVIRPLDSVGVYVPGGKAAYPSSVLMNVIPAKVAGVERIVMTVPAPHSRLEPVVLAAAEIAGVDTIYSIGGAQAIAALAYGTETLSPVDKIVGPGNIYVATAKSLLFGTVGIDMIAGPSEILIVCDGRTDPDWVAMDLFSQAEHDEAAQAILLCPDVDFLNAVQKSIERLLPTLERREVIARSLTNRGAFIKVRDLHEAIDLVNRIAPEHLELSVDNPRQYLPAIRHAGAIFLGRYTAEALGDYCAGPNHVLPTSGTARFFSPLGVYDFQKRSSIIECSPAGASRLANTATILANGEGLTAHGRSAAYRCDA